MKPTNNFQEWMDIVEQNSIGKDDETLDLLFFEQCELYPELYFLDTPEIFEGHEFLDDTPQ